MAKWIDVAPAEELGDGQRKCVSAEDKQLAVFNVDGELYAVENVCPHAGLPLGQGDLAGKVITCPFHGFAYNVETGKNVDYPQDVPLPRFEVKIDGERVLVNVDEE